ncbi:hypothetical protein F2Q69_00018534 [Brassica cretica]|uniref:DC1 domain-containing protein n=1 Tax=Brassica cretica TaxID=69181 RepID=A0A8S9QN42_BRACR|nr:hypothetical protein F2Q69_00018534 [Brassica cretica]
MDSMEHPPPSRLICPSLRAQNTYLHIITTALTPYIGATTKNQKMSLLGVLSVSIDENYGKYCCTKNCTYVVHSKCAIRQDVWDGIELEEVAEEEEEEESENLNSFEVIGDETISLDVRCAAISEPFDHQSHPHPLFLMRYEHDEHFLTLSNEENASLKWCEVCEETLDSYKWLYTCNECAVAFHIACLLGKCAFYVKPAQNLLYNGETKINITLSNGLTRPICTQCQKRCQDKLVVQFLDDYDGEVISCYRHWEVNRTKSQEFERWWRKK